MRIPAHRHLAGQKAGVKEQIVDITFNGTGVRDTARTLKIGINTVFRTLKTHAEANNVFASRPFRCGAYLRTR
jgi:transposase-like protein